MKLSKLEVIGLIVAALFIGGVLCVAGDRMVGG